MEPFILNRSSIDAVLNLVLNYMNQLIYRNQSKQRLIRIPVIDQIRALSGSDYVRVCVCVCVCVVCEGATT